MQLYAWCVMTNHIHLMAREKGESTFADILRDFKKFTSKAIIRAIVDNSRERRKKFHTSKGYRFWRGDYNPIEVWSPFVIQQKLNYVQQNPVVQHIVTQAED